MSWKESTIMDEKLKFIARYLEGETITKLCQDFGVSRTTGHNLIKRYRQMGSEALVAQNRAPKRYANRLPIEVESLILDLKRKYENWGAPKIREKIIKAFPHVKAPARSTVHAVLDRNGLVKKRKGRKRYKNEGTKLTHVKSPNDLWCADYKGEFMTSDKRYCYPLTITDYSSRFLIGCDAFTSTAMEFAFESFEKAFMEYGVPKAIRTDNGSPFASAQSFYHLTQLSVWWMRLGINVERSRPGCPQDNGRHERMHLTLKQETTRPSRANLTAQQEEFDKFIRIYNDERPHAGIDNKYPSELYKASSREYKKPEPIYYPFHDQTVTVSQCGRICTKGLKVSLSKAFAGVEVGIKEMEDGIWVASFLDYDLGYFDDKSSKVEPITDPFSMEKV